ncbi:MAG: hypothetical protein AAF802_17505 [Planctomycetota bacterium]
MTTNPYQPPPNKKRPSDSRKKFALLAAIAALLIGLMLIGPGLASLMIGEPPGMQGKRYATYDHELFLFGIPMSLAAGRALSFGVGVPLLLIAAALFRGSRR